MDKAPELRFGDMVLLFSFLSRDFSKFCRMCARRVAGFTLRLPWSASSSSSASTSLARGYGRREALPWWNTLSGRGGCYVKQFAFFLIQLSNS